MKKNYPNNLRYFIIVSIVWLFGVLQDDLYAQLPSDFQRVDLVTDLSNATTFKFSPDGRIFILDRYGEVLIYKPSTQTTVSAGSLSVFHDLEDGLLGIAFDPNFTDNSYIYLHYSPLSTLVNRVSRFTMNGDILDLGSEITLLEWTTQRTAYYHAAGDMDFDSQGNLYIATGDNSNHSDYATLNETNPLLSSENTSSNTNDLRGKILRITPQSNGSYTIPSGNLFPVGTPLTRAEIYVMGARNPYRIFVDKENSDWLFWGEVGPDANTPSSLGPEGLDEINLVQAAGNYGWPYLSGENQPYLNTYSNPQFYYDPAAPVNISTWNTGITNLPAAQPSWLDFFHGSYMVGPRYTYDPLLTDQQRLPIEFDNIFFYWNFNNSNTWAVTMDASGNILSNERLAPSVFPTSSDGFIDMQIGPDGHLYILAYGTGCCPQNTGTGKLIRVDYTGIVSNSSPVVTLDADPTNGSLPLLVNFSSVGTFDPDGDTPLTYEWDFDTTVPSTDSTAENPSFTYTVAGDYNAQLRVDDGNGGIGVKNITINAGNNAATFTFNSPPDGGLVGWGDDISIDIDVTDVEDGSTSGGGIDCNDVNVVPSLGHLNHFHDDLALTGCPQTITLETEGHDIDGEADIFFVLGSNYTDQGGLISFDQMKLHPKRKEAEFYDTQSGVIEIANTDPLEGGSEAIRVDHDGYISFTGRNLLNINSVKYKVAAASIGGTIEFRVGSPTGTLLATTVVPVTGSSDTWVAVESTFTDPGGKNDLYFVFKNNPGQSGIFDLNYVEFLGNGVSVDNSPPEVNEVVSTSSTGVRVEFSENVDQGTAETTGNYTIDNGVTVLGAVLQSDNRTVLLATSPLSSGVQYNLTISNVENTVGLPIVSGSYPFFIFDSLHINSGGPQLLIGGETFIADQYAGTGSTFSNAVPIGGTTDDELYQTERYGTFSYEIPIPVSGDYDIRLHFAEIFFGLPGSGSGGGVGSRVFNVTIEGSPVLTDFDILSEVSPATVLLKEFDDITISDGFASIAFTSVTGDPKISAIEILPPDTFSPTANITITSPNNGWDVNQPFDVNFTVENWVIEQGGTHMHYYIDDVMVGPHYSYGPITIDGLSLGNHTIKLELYEAGHIPTGVFDEVTVNVTNQISCNSMPFPDQWGVKQLETTSLPYRSVYTFADFDLDGDGLKDIVTGGWWYKNPGSVSGNWVRSDIGNTFNNVAFVYDFDGDGDLDLLGTTGAYTGADLVWAQNDGSGNFTIFSNIPSGNTNYSEPFLAGIAGGVFSSGGSYQMAINWNGAEVTGSPVQMLTVPNDPTSGTWSLVDISPDSSGEDMQTGDIDGDGDLDLFQGINWLRNNGDTTWTTFDTGITYVTTPDRNQLADFDRDGDLDAVVGQLGLGSNPQRSEFAWFEAPADPTQLWTRRLLDTDVDGSLSVFATDIDFDGDEDIVVGEWLGSHRLIVFDNNLCVDGTFTKRIIDAGNPIQEHHDGARVVDIDNDGDLDIISNGWVDNFPRIYENTSAGSQAPIADAGEDQTIILPTNSITLNGSGTDPDGGSITGYLWTQESGPSTATLSGDTSADLTASALVEGIYVFRLTVTDDESDTGFDEVNVTVVDPTTAIRINSGGPDFTHNGDNWSADQYFQGGSVTGSALEIANTSNDQLYQTERYATSGTLTYEIPVTNGDHNLNLHFAEIYYGLPGGGSGGGAGSRVFNIDIENGQQLINNYDIIVAAGGSATAVVENFTAINVADGNLTITLTAVTEFPKISGIEVFGTGASSLPPVADADADKSITLPIDTITLDGSGYDPDGGAIITYLWSQESGPSTATLSGETTDDLTASGLLEGTYVFRLTVTDDENETGFDEVAVEVTNIPGSMRINSGGPGFNFNGEDWTADQYFLDGSIFENVIPIANTLNDELYQTERFTTGSTLTYEIPVELGSHNVDLHFAELYFGVAGPGSGGGIGSRVFNIDIENGQQSLNNYDIVLAAGGSATAVIENFVAVNVTDGFLTIILTSVVENPKISGISLIENRPPIVDAGSDQNINLPANDVTINGTAIDPDGGVITTYQWTQESGPNTATLVGDTTESLTASGLLEGTYVFRLTATDDENETGFDEVNVLVLEDNSNQPPVVTNPGDQSNFEGEVISMQIEATDPESGVLDYAATGLPTGLTIDSASGLISGTVTAGAAASSPFAVTITVSDDGTPIGSAMIAFEWVIDITTNLPPVVTNPGDQSNFEGEVVSLQIQATDPESGVLDYTATGLPTGLTIDSGNGLISGTVSAGAAAASPFAVTVTVSDDGSPVQSTSVNFDWSISDTINMPPIAVASANRNSGIAPLAVIFNGESSSDDIGIITYAWDFMDGSVSSEINPNHTFTADGTYNVELTVTDAGGLPDTAIVTIVVGDSSNLPPIAVLEATPTSGDAPLEVTFVGGNSTDDFGVVSYLWDFGDGSTSTEMDPSYIYTLPGDYTVVLTVEDAGGLTNPATTTILVEAVAGEMMGIILENPSKEGIAKIQVINQPSDIEVMTIYLHDSSGRLVGSFDPQDVFTGNSYEVPVGTVRTGIYYIGLEMSNGDALLLKLLVNN